jgi:3-oxoacyl-[acyl-carrier-protein] synthase III
MSLPDANLTEYLLSVLRGVLEDLGIEQSGTLGPDVRFSDVFDSMAMVEFLGIVADDCSCEMSAIEEAVDQRFHTIRHLAEAMQSARLFPRQTTAEDAAEPAHAGSVGSPMDARTARQLAGLRQPRDGRSTEPRVWLAGSAHRLPRTIQLASELNAEVGRPAGWLERRAGILQRCVWGSEDPVEVSAGCAADALRDARIPRDRVGALLVVSEAPPLAVGLAAAVHERIGLRADAACYETGGACTGFLSALSLARALAPEAGPTLVVSVEAHSRLLPIEMGLYGESAALFGDGCAAVVLSPEAAQPPAARLIDLATFVDGGAGELIRVQPRGTGSYCLEMEGVPLTEFALHALSTATREIAAKHSLSLNKVAAIVAHGGNGRMPAMLARMLHLPAAKVWSEVAQTGNLGSASVPVAWASRKAPPTGHVIWSAVGAGLLWGAALWEIQAASHGST